MGGTVLPAQYLVEQIGRLALPSGGEEEAQRPAEGLGRLEGEKPFSPAVEDRDAASQIDTDDGFPGSFDQGGEAGSALVALAALGGFDTQGVIGS